MAGRLRLGVALDSFTALARLGGPRPGDLVLIGAAGAYNRNAANGWAGPVPPLVTLRG